MQNLDKRVVDIAAKALEQAGVDPATAASTAQANQSTLLTQVQTFRANAQDIYDKVAGPTGGPMSGERAAWSSAFQQLAAWAAANLV